MNIVPEINYLMELDPTHVRVIPGSFILIDDYEEWLNCQKYEEVKGG